MTATVEYVESPYHFGIVVGEELIQPFASKRAAISARSRGAWAADAVVRPIRWVKDERYTSGARAIVVEPPTCVTAGDLIEILRHWPELTPVRVTAVYRDGQRYAIEFEDIATPTDYRDGGINILVVPPVADRPVSEEL